MDELEFQFKAFEKLRKQKASVALNLLVSLFCYLVVCSGGNRQTDRQTDTQTDHVQQPSLSMRVEG